MRIIDIDKEYESLYFVCLEDWSSELKEAGNHKALWYEKMKDRGLKVKLALDDEGVVCGMVEYLPIEQAVADGKDSYFINCLWVHGHKQGRGDQRKKGYGRALLEAAQMDAKSMGAKGMTAQGITLPFWIPASFFKRHGYKVVDKDGIAVLLYKSFEPNSDLPKFLKQKKSPEKQKNPRKVTVTFLLNGYCPARNMVFERAKRAAQELGDKVVFEPVDTSNRNTLLEWGMNNELFIEDKKISFGAPLSYEKIVKLIQKQIRKLK